MKHYEADFIETLFSAAEIIDIIKKGIISFSSGSYRIPERMHIPRGTSTNLIMPAFTNKYFCTKLISVDPENRNTHFPVISGLLILNCNSNGVVVATMDAPAITALRTAAIGSIGMEIIHPNRLNALGIIGLGVQGYWQSVFALSTQKISDVYCTSRSKEKFEAYALKIHRQFPEVNLHWCKDGNEVVKQSELIISCTTSIDPVFSADVIDITKKRFISVGSFRKDMQEMPKQVYRNADVLLLDTKSAKTEVGDVSNALHHQWIDDECIVTLSEIIGGTKIISPESNIVFKSVGMAAFDLSLAIAVYEKMNQENK